MTSYYIRQLLSLRQRNLKFVVAPKAALKATALSDINAVIDSLYPDVQEAGMVAQKLESLTSMHQVFKQDENMYFDNLTLIEKEIYWLLGFKYVD